MSKLEEIAKQGAKVTLNPDQSATLRSVNEVNPDGLTRYKIAFYQKYCYVKQHIGKSYY